MDLAAAAQEHVLGDTHGPRSAGCDGGSSTRVSWFGDSPGCPGMVFPGETSGFPVQVRSASLGSDSNFQHSSSVSCMTTGSFLPTTANLALAFCTQNELLEWRRSFADAAELRAAQGTGEVRPEQLF